MLGPYDWPIRVINGGCPSKHIAKGMACLGKPSAQEQRASQATCTLPQRRPISWFIREMNCKTSELPYRSFFGFPHRQCSRKFIWLGNPPERFQMLVAHYIVRYRCHLIQSRRNFLYIVFFYVIQNSFKPLPFSYGVGCQTWPLDGGSVHRGSCPRILGILESYSRSTTPLAC